LEEEFFVVGHAVSDSGLRLMQGGGGVVEPYAPLVDLASYRSILVGASHL
jgi:hypothetical protein